MSAIIKWIVLWLIGKYLPGYHLHRDQARKVKAPESMEEGKGNE